MRRLSPRACPDLQTGTVLAVGVAALLYLVTEELLVEAHEVRENTVTTAMFIVGFLVLLMVDVLT